MKTYDVGVKIPSWKEIMTERDRVEKAVQLKGSNFSKAPADYVFPEYKPWIHPPESQFHRDAMAYIEAHKETQ